MLVSKVSSIEQLGYDENMRPTVVDISKSVLRRLTDGNPQGPVAARWLKTANEKIDYLLQELYAANSPELAQVHALQDFIDRCPVAEDGQWQSLALGLLAKREGTLDRLILFLRQRLHCMFDSKEQMEVLDGKSAIDEVLDIMEKAQWVNQDDYREFISRLRGKGPEFSEEALDLLQGARIWQRMKITSCQLAPLLSHYLEPIRAQDEVREALFSLLMKKELAMDEASSLSVSLAHSACTAIGSISGEEERHSIENKVHISRAFAQALLQELFSNGVAVRALRIFDNVIFNHLGKFFSDALMKVTLPRRKAEQLCQLLRGFGDVEAKDALVRRCQHWAARVYDIKDHLFRAKLLSAMFRDDDGRKSLESISRYCLCDKDNHRSLTRLYYELALHANYEVASERKELKQRVEDFFDKDTLGTTRKADGSDKVRHRTNLDVIEELLARL